MVHFKMPASEGEIPEGYFQEGEAVVYHSRTQGAYLRTRITKIHAAAGVVTAIDLTCKTSCDLSKIAKIQENSSDWQTDLQVLSELPSPLRENCEMAVVGRGQAAVQKDTVRSKIRSKGLKDRSLTQDALSPSVKFNVGDKVYYESRSHGRKVLAIVEGITSEGFYDLDVKKFADPRNLSPYIAETVEDYAAVRHPVQLPLQPVRADGTPRLESALTPLGFGAAEFVASRHTGEGEVVSCKVSPAVPVGRVLSELPSPLHVENADFGDGICDDGRLVRSKVLHKTKSQLEARSPLMKFNVGDKVYYQSKSFGQRIIATVEGITSEGFYDLDVRQSADPKNISPYIEFPAAKPLDQEAFAEFVAKFRGELHCPGAFEPKLSTVRQQLLAHLSLSESASIKEMTGFKGGLNQGIWIVSDYSQKLVLKQTRCQRIAVNVMTEAENFVRIARDHPEITNDPMIAFPVKIFSCIGPEGKISDVIAMKKCPGERLCEFVAHKFYANQMSQLTHALELVGQSLSQFHFRYGHEQHGDFQPSNIYYEESTDTVTFIDVGGMGVPTLGGDVDHFHQCIRAMTSSYQANLFVELLRAFDKGYQSPCTPRLQQGFRALR